MEKRNKSQREIVEAVLKDEGEISNVWAFQHYILRLGAIIHMLRKDGWNIATEMRGRVCFYKLVRN